MNIPTYLTCFRVGIIPLLMILYYIPGGWVRVVTVSLFVLAALTDLLDGYLARKWQQTSKFGAFLDPVADKLIVAVVLVLVVANPDLPYLAIPVAVIIGRELVISGLREWMAEIGKRATISVSYLGKMKTVIQLVSVAFLLANTPALPKALLYFDYVVGYGGIYLSAILTLWTMFAYIKAAWPDFELNF